MSVIDRLPRWLPLIPMGAGVAIILFAPASAGTIKYTYDEFGQLKTATYPNNTAVTYTYDAASNRSQVAAAPAVNHNPIAADDSDNRLAGGTFDEDVLANDSDPDVDALTIQSFTENSPIITVSIVSNKLRINSSTAGAAFVDYVVSDGRGGTDTGRLILDLE